MENESRYRRKYNFTLEDVLWWELFKINMGDEVVIIKSGDKGRVTAMSVPMFHLRGIDPKIFYYERTEYYVSKLGKKDRMCKRWEIRKA